MGKFHPIVVRLLNMEKYHFTPREKTEELIGFEVHYLSAFWALVYLANYTCHDISVVVNILARCSSPTT